MADQIGHGEVRLSVNDSEFAAGFERAEQRARDSMNDIERMEATARATADIRELERKVLVARKAMQELEREHADPKVGMDSAEFFAKKKAIEAAIKQLSLRKADIAMNVRHGRQVEREARNFADALDDVTNNARRADLEARKHSATVTRLQDRYAQLTNEQRKLEAVRPWDRTDRDVTRLRRVGAEMDYIRAQLRALDAREVEIDVEVNRPMMDRITSALRAMTGGVDSNESTLRRWASSLARIRLHLGFFSLSVGQAIKALILLGPVLTGLVGTAGALISTMGVGLVGALVAATGAIAGFGLAAGGIGGIIAAQGGKLSRFKGDVTDLRDRWTRLTRSARPSLFDTVREAIQSANKLMPMFARQSTATFRTASKGMRDWLRGLRSEEARGIFQTIFKNFRAGLPDLMSGLGRLTTAIGRLSASASRLIAPMMDSFDDWALGIERSTRDAGALDRTVNMLGSHASSLVNFLGASGRVVWNFFMSGAESGQRLLDEITDIFNETADWLASVEGRNTMREFFEDSIATGKRVVELLTNMIEIILNIADVARPVTNAFLDIANAASDAVNAIRGFGPVGAILDKTVLALAALWAGGKLARGIGGVLTGLPLLGRGFSAVGQKAQTAANRIVPLPSAMDRTAASQRRLAGAATRGAGAFKSWTIAGAGAASSTQRVGTAAARSTGMLARLSGGMARAGSATLATTAAMTGLGHPMIALGVAAGAAGLAMKQQGIAAAEDDSTLEKVRYSLLGVNDPLQSLPTWAKGGATALAGLGQDTYDAAGALEFMTARTHDSRRAARGAEEGALGLAQAVLQERAAARQAGDLERQLAQMRRQGMRGTRQYRAVEDQLAGARIQEVQAGQNVRNQERQITRARHESVRAAKEALAKASEYYREEGEGLGRVRDAQERLNHAQARSTSTALNVRRAMQGLSPIARRAGADIRYLTQQFGRRQTFQALLKVNDEEAARKLSKFSAQLAQAGRKRAVSRILLDDSGANQKIRELQRLLRDVEKPRRANVNARTSQAVSALLDVDRAGERAEKPRNVRVSEDGSSSVLGALARVAGFRIPDKVAGIRANDSPFWSVARSIIGSVLGSAFVNIVGKKSMGGVLSWFAEGGAVAAQAGLDERALRRAQRRSPEPARSQRVNRPTLLTGEQAPGWPEFVIATNPAYQRQNRTYLLEAARALGMVVIEGAAQGRRGGGKGKGGGKGGPKVPGFPNLTGTEHWTGPRSKYTELSNNIQFMDAVLSLTRQKWDQQLAGTRNWGLTRTGVQRHFGTAIAQYQALANHIMNKMLPGMTSDITKKPPKRPKKLKGDKKRKYEDALRNFNDTQKQLADEKSRLKDEFRMLTLIDIPRLRAEVFDVPKPERPEALEPPGMQAITSNLARFELFRQFASNAVQAAPLPVATGAGVPAGAAVGTPEYYAPGVTTRQPKGGPVGGNTYNVTNNYLTPPPDPHTWSRQQEFELAALG